MQTSNFANLKKIEEAGLVPISIAVGNPRWYGSSRMRLLSLAPTRSMLKESREDYDLHFKEILQELEANQVLEEIEKAWGAENVVMLCWESPNVWCHRRLVAEWFELKCGITVPEFGMDRDRVFKYSLMPAKE